MEQFEEHTVDSSSLGFGLDESPQFPDPDLQRGDDSAANPEDSEQSTSTDDPVRVYLREMGSVSLLTRQAEIDLARRMERGKLRMQQALSRLPLVRRNVLALYEDV